MNTGRIKTWAEALGPICMFFSALARESVNRWCLQPYISCQDGWCFTLLLLQSTLNKFFHLTPQASFFRKLSLSVSCFFLSYCIYIASLGLCSTVCNNRYSWYQTANYAAGKEWGDPVWLSVCRYACRQEWFSIDWGCNSDHCLSFSEGLWTRGLDRRKGGVGVTEEWKERWSSLVYATAVNHYFSCCQLQCSSRGITCCQGCVWRSHSATFP